MKEFKDTIQKYLQERAAEDILFAPRLANPKKSIDECCRYILGEARKRGTSVGKVPVGSSVSSSHKVELTEEEKNAARQAAIKRLTEEQYRSLKKRPAKKKVDESVQQMSLF